MKQLPPSTVRLLASTQVITGAASVVKELVENSLDAGGTALEIRLENFGMDKLEVRDNGTGISCSDIPYAAKRHYTSKISSHDDLESLQTLGFRGEALGAIAAISEMTVVTKCVEEAVGHSYKLDNKGNIVDEANTPTVTGTCISANNLYKGIPVRRQYYSADKRKREELKRITDLLMSYGTNRHSCRFTLKHNKSVIWQKNSADSVIASLIALLTPAVGAQLCHHSINLSDDTSCDLYISDSKKEALFRTSSDRMFFFINHRHIRDKELEKLIRACACRSWPHKYPVCYLHLTIPPGHADVNLEPDKTKVLLTNKIQILEKLEEYLKGLFGEAEIKKSGKDINVQPLKPVENLLELSSDTESPTNPPSVSSAEPRSDSVNKPQPAQPSESPNKSITEHSTEHLISSFREDSLLAGTHFTGLCSTMLEKDKSGLQEFEKFLLSSDSEDDWFPAPGDSDGVAKAGSETLRQTDKSDVHIVASPDSQSVKPLSKIGSSPAAKQPLCSQQTNDCNKSNACVARDVIVLDDSSSVTDAGANEWVRGNLFAETDQPVQLAARVARDSVQRSPVYKQKLLSGEGFGSIIREETIPDHYKQFASSSTRKRRKLNTPTTPQPSIRSMLNNSKSTVQVERTNSASRVTDFSLCWIQSQYRKALQPDTTEKTVDGAGLTLCGLIGPTPGAIVLSGDDILTFNPLILKEEEIYESHMKNYELPSQPVSISLDEGMMSSEAWDKLTSLPLARERVGMVLSDSLLRNGFALRRDTERYLLMATPHVIPGYGYLSDLEGVLVSMGSEANCYRPPMVCQHIKDEVVKQTKHLKVFSREQVTDLLATVAVTRKDLSHFVCSMHNNRSFTPLYKLPSAATSSDDQ